MAVLLLALEKIRVYDRGFVQPSTNGDSFGEFQFSYRYGDTYSPRLSEVEPLKAECKSFLDSISQGTPPMTDGSNGLEVVRVIQAAERSLVTHHGEVPVYGADKRPVRRPYVAA